MAENTGNTNVKDNIDELIEFIINRHDDKYIDFNNFNQIKQLIDQEISQSNQTAKNILDWLRENQGIKQYIWLFELFYYHNIGVVDNSGFRMFLRLRYEKCYSFIFHDNLNST